MKSAVSHRNSTWHRTVTVKAMNFDLVESYRLFLGIFVNVEKSVRFHSLFLWDQCNSSSIKRILAYKTPCLLTGLTCQHVSRAVDLNSVKKSVLSSVWSVCSECLKERTMIDGEPAASQDILVCLKCGFQVSFFLKMVNKAKCDAAEFKLN